MDSLSHMLIAWILLQLVNAVYLLPFAILGSLIPDLDVFSMVLSKRFPRLYIFTHGGFTHSIVGAIVTAGAIYAGTLIAGEALSVPVWDLGAAPFLVILLMGFVHLLLDSLAYPGIPVLYPFSHTKYTWGVFPGPSIFVLGFTLVFLAAYPVTHWNCPSTALYVVVFSLFLGISVLYKGGIAIALKGRTIPTFNPFVWLTIEETADVFTVRKYLLLRGYRDTKIYPKYNRVTPSEVEPYKNSMEVQQLLYNSYIMIAERDNEGIVLRDPLREDGFIFYPNQHTRVHLPPPKMAMQEYHA
ncbi:MAG: metal-dependent hydrolase [Methanomicrobiales archaeon]|nr:metal-dependent hydrolase [Methanomicrobiales archaeon]